MKIKVNKNLISTYISLNNKKADEYLVNLANQIKNEIIGSSDNDEIFEYLNVLAEFVYKVPEETIKIMQYIIEEEPKPVKFHKTAIGELKGKSHVNLIRI